MEGDIGTYRRSGGEVKLICVKRILHTKKAANEIRSWGDLWIKKYKLDVQSHSNRQSTLRVDGTKNGDAHND